jgi:hypothetical protein
MKRILSALAFVATVLLAACGGGQEAEGVTFREVPLASPQASLASAIIPTTTTTTTAVTTPKVRPPIAAPETTPSVPQGTTDLTISGVAINVNRTTVNVGERNLNVNAFNGSFAANSGDATIQELVYRNPYGGNNYELFSDVRFVDAVGSICPQASCYVNWGPGPEVRVVFIYGWKPTSELQVLALQVDMISSMAAVGRKFSLPLIGIQMRQWGKTVSGLVSGKAMEITVGVPLPTIDSPIATQLVNATIGNQYNILNVVASCPADVRMYCAAQSVEVYTDAADLTYSGGAVSWISPGTYLVEMNHYLSPGQSVTFSFHGVASGVVVYTQVGRTKFNVDGVEVSPIVQNQSVQVIDLAGGRG